MKMKKKKLNKKNTRIPELFNLLSYTTTTLGSFLISPIHLFTSLFNHTLKPAGTEKTFLVFFVLKLKIGLIS